MKYLKSLRMNVRGALLLVVGFVSAVAVMTDWTPATAQVSPTRIAVVDVEAVLTRSKLGKAIYAELNKHNEDAQRQYNAETDPAKRQQIKLSAEKKYTDTRDRLLANADTRMMPIIQTLGKELKAAAIFRKFESGLIYSDDTLDITNTVIQRIDAATP